MLRSFEGVTLTFNGSVIHASEEVRNLGVVVDRHLSYRAHVDDLSRRCTGMLIALNNSRHVIPKRVLPKLIQALVTGHAVPLHHQVLHVRIRVGQRTTVEVCAEMD